MGKIIIYGTTSSAGKSFLTMALCRILSNKGYQVAPFKSQNMSRNYSLTKESHIISNAQFLQALAAKRKPDIRMNPILLVPATDTGSEVYLKGKYLGKMEAKEYFSYKKKLGPLIREIFYDLYNQVDHIIIEGAGSPAEINLLENDIVNTGMAKIADSNAILVVDIDKGGAFAHLYGTYFILDEEDRKRIRGFVINKFRGDPDLLKPAIDKIEELTGVPVIGIIPYGSYKIPDEDSLVDGRKEINMDDLNLDEIHRQIDKLAQDVESSINMNKLLEIMGC